MAKCFYVGKTNVSDILKSWIKNDNWLSKHSFPKTLTLAFGNLTYLGYAEET